LIQVLQKFSHFEQNFNTKFTSAEVVSQRNLLIFLFRTATQPQTNISLYLHPNKTLPVQLENEHGVPVASINGHVYVWKGTENTRTIPGSLNF